MEPARLVEARLVGTEPLRQAEEHAGGHAEIVVQGGSVEMDRFDGELPAKSAAGRRNEVTLPTPLGQVQPSLGGYVYDVAEVGIFRITAVCDVVHFFLAGEDAFGEEKGGRQLVIFPRRTHHHGDTLSSQPDLER